MNQFKIIVLFLLFSQFGFAQNYELIDNKVKNYPVFENIDALTIRILNDFQETSDRVRAAYFWMATNINYDLESSKEPSKIITYTFRSENEFQEQKKNYLTKKINEVFKSRKALCSGYSDLFVALCERMDIEAISVKGVTKVEASEINQLRNIKDHAWNAVKINDRWALLDITWSTGFVDGIDGTYQKSFNDFFFLREPAEFLYSHFPELVKWQLVEHPISLSEFFKKPIFYPSYFESGITLAPDQKGMIISKNKIVLFFQDIPKGQQLYYRFENDVYIKPLSIKHFNPDNFVAKIKDQRPLTGVLTIYAEETPIIDFKIN